MRRVSGSRTDITCTEIPGRSSGTVASPPGLKPSLQAALAARLKPCPPALPYQLLFQNWIVAIGDQAAAHDFGVFDVGVGADLHTEEFVDGGVVGGEGGVLLSLQRLDQGVGVFLASYGSNLDVVGVGGWGGCCGILVALWRLGGSRGCGLRLRVPGCEFGVGFFLFHRLVEAEITGRRGRRRRVVFRRRGSNHGCWSARLRGQHVTGSHSGCFASERKADRKKPGTDHY